MRRNSVSRGSKSGRARRGSPPLARRSRSLASWADERRSSVPRGGGRDTRARATTAWRAVADVHPARGALHPPVPPIVSALAAAVVVRGTRSPRQSTTTAVPLTPTPDHNPLAPPPPTGTAEPPPTGRRPNENTLTTAPRASRKSSASAPQQDRNASRRRPDRTR